MVDPNDPILAGKIFQFAHVMSNSEHADGFNNVVDLVIALREKVRGLEQELKHGPRQEEYRKLWKEKEQWRAGALKIKKQLELEKGQNEYLKKGALSLTENLIEVSEKLKGERQEREAAQRTISRLGGGE